ncbi:E3 ubiquitin-protein ligase arc-1-like [Amphiura filiformis]|uniref:E3 ubiquitin-protein ligase arc-1-like n=1 Tax=Amphiura filiformis TaxID=82378 RepID=UPI003B21AE9E
MAASLVTQPYDITKCSKCHQPLNSPKTLPCLHSYCESCLEGHATDSLPNSNVKCIECGEEFDIPPGGLKEWQPLAIVHRLTEQKAMQMQLMSEETIPCTACAGAGYGGVEEDQGVKSDLPTAVARCTECDEYLCKRCVTMHKTLRVLKNHPIVTLDELREGKFPEATATEQKMCVKHKGEALLFYCETCDVPICRQCVVITHRHPDHKQAELEQVVKEKKEQLQQMQGSCGKNDEEVSKALQEIRKIRRDFDLAVSEARIQIKDTVNKLKSSYLKRLDEARKATEEELNIIEKEGLETIKSADNQLTSIISRISTAKAVTKLLKESGSEFEVASDYGSLKTVVDDVVGVEPASIIHSGKNLTNVKFEENTVQNSDKIVIGRVWSRSTRRTRELKNKTPVLKMEFGNDGNEKFALAFDVAVTPTRDIAVTDHSAAKVKIFNADGAFKTAFNVNVGVDAGRQSNPWCIQVGTDNLFYVTDSSSPYVKIFDFQGTYKRYFHTVSPDNVAYNTHGSSSLRGLAINTKNTQVLVGNVNHNFISCHSLDGTHLSSIKITIAPHFLAATLKGNIIVSPYSTGEVHIIDEAGKILSKLQPPIGVSSLYTSGLVVSKCFSVDGDEDEVFVADNANGRAVYRYSASGKYIDCVTKGLSSHIYSIALSADDKLLFVANLKSVRCFEI